MREHGNVDALAARSKHPLSKIDELLDRLWQVNIYRARFAVGEVSPFRRTPEPSLLCGVRKDTQTLHASVLKDCPQR